MACVNSPAMGPDAPPMRRPDDGFRHQAPRTFSPKVRRVQAGRNRCLVAQWKWSARGAMAPGGSHVEKATGLAGRRRGGGALDERAIDRGRVVLASTAVNSLGWGARGPTAHRTQ